ncbi:hypothetical protein C8J56DRAFT_1014285 [Mycena floridula]|nr:hypothetical protein C8J56DRAFT_1014285 [Mycena floridula]
MSTRKSSTSSLIDARKKQSKQGLRPVSAPLYKTRLSNLIYVLVLLSGVIFAFYGYRAFQMKREVGGWWNFVLKGKRTAYPNQPVHVDFHGSAKEHAAKQERGSNVESLINELANALGMQSKDLAVAIASAVKEFVPPASLSSIAAEQTGKSEIVEELLNPSKAKEDINPEGAGIVGGVLGGIETMVGMDEP